MKILRIAFIEAPEMADQYIRSYDTDFKSGMVEDAIRAVDTGVKVSAAGLSKIATRLIRPVGSAFHSKIDNGWNNRRIKFAMMVEVDDRKYSIEHAYITGYTDHSEYSMLGSRVRFSPDMRLYFNSISYVNLMDTEYRGSIVQQPHLKRHDQILNRSVFGGDRLSDKGLLRPTDLFRRRGMDNEMGMLGDNRVNDFYTTRHNRIGAFSGQLVANTRQNNSPSRFLQRSISAYVGGSENSRDFSMSGFDADQDDVLDEATVRVEENLLDGDPIFNRMKSDSNIMQQGFITFGELMEMNPDFDEDRNLGFKAQGRRSRRFDTSDSMRSDTVEAIAANILAQSLPTIMLNSMYSMIQGLTINTRVRDGQDKVMLAMAQPFMDGLSPASTLDYFLDQIEFTVLGDMTQGGNLDIEASIDADIDGELEIRIIVDGGEEAYFPYPMYADSLLPPVLTNDMETLDRVSTDILSIGERFYRERTNNAPNHISLNNRSQSNRSTREEPDW